MQTIALASEPGTPGQPDQRVEVTLKDVYNRACTALDKGQKPTTELKQMRDSLRKAADLDRVANDSAFSKFVYYNSLVNRLLNVHSDNIDVSTSHPPANNSVFLL